MPNPSLISILPALNDERSISIVERFTAEDERFLSVLIDFMTALNYHADMINSRYTKAIRSIWRFRTIRHVFYWVLAFLLFYLTVLMHDSHAVAIEVASIIIIPAPVPVYLHFIALKYFFEKRMYFLYFSSLVVILLFSGFVIEQVFYMIVLDPNSRTSGIATALFFILFTTGLKYFTQGMRKQYLLQESESKRLQTELTLLKSQLHPHFFFNTLNNLYALSMERSDIVPGLILKLSSLMRYVLYCSRKKTVSLKDEIDFIKNYVELERLRVGENQDILFQVDGNLSEEEIAPLLLIPFVENGFKHGLMTTAKNGYIHINSTIHDDRFLFTVENSKLKNSSGTDDGCNRIGLENVMRRLELYYPESHSLDIQEDNDRFYVELTIRL